MDGIPQTLCLTWTGLTGVDEALVRYDGFPATRREWLDELGQWSPPPELGIVVADRLGDGVLLAECTAAHGIRPPVLRRMSAGTVAVCVCWSTVSTGHVGYAVDGRLLSLFDLGSGGTDAGTDPAAVAPLLAGLDFGVTSAQESALTFLERVAGTRLIADWVRAGHPASVIVDPELFDRAGPLTEPVPERPATLRAAADLAVARVAPEDTPLPDPATLGDAEREAVRAGLLAAARESYRDGVEYYWEPYEEDDDEPTGGGIDDLVAEMQAAQDGEAAARAAMRRAHGWAAARGRLLADPSEALATVLTQARLADPDGWPRLRDEIAGRAGQ